jgi:[ribosomal protein S18]-alanine N-acetyltransferase
MDEIAVASGSARARRPAYIRQARTDDLSALHDVDEAVFGDLAYPLFVLRQFVDVHQRHFLVVDADPPLLGYVLAAYAARTDEAWLLGLGVHPDARKYGYGRALMERCLDRLRRDGAHAVRLTVKPGNTAAIKLYEAIGFKKTAFIPHYYGDGEGRYEMVASLAGQQTTKVGAVP